MPRTMSLNLSCDCPACSPSAVWNEMTILGPCSGERVPGQPCPDRNGDERNCPDQGYTPRAPDRGALQDPGVGFTHGTRLTMFHD